MNPGLSWGRRRLIAILVCACVAAIMMAGAPHVGFAESGSETWGPGWLRKMFVDEDEAAWAVGYMAKVKAKGLVTGYPGGFFKPNSQVSRAELIATAVRLLGGEDDAKSRDGAVLPFIDASYIEAQYPWAVGYLAEALSQGLLPSSSEAFRPYMPATRAWAAEVFVRALGMGSDALAKMDSQLPFADRYSVPYDKVGYVFVANVKGIMKGSGDTFRPNQSLSRAELAAVLVRCDDYLGPSSSNELRGTVSSVGSDGLSLTIRTYDSNWWSKSRREGEAAQGGKVTVSVMPGALILLDKRHADLSDLNSGYTVTVIKTGSYASVVDAHTRKTVGWPGYAEDEDDDGDAGSGSLVEGTIRETELGRYPTIRIRDEDGVSKTYDVADDCEVKRNGYSADLEDLRAGDRVTLRLDSYEVVRITAETEDEADEVVSGEIAGVSSSKNRITLELDTGNTRVITVSSGADITRDGEYAELGDLRVGDEAEVAVRDSKAVRTTVGGDSAGSRNGTVTRLRTSSTSRRIYIETGSGSERGYDVSSSVTVDYDGMALQFEDIVEGDEVVLRLVSSKVRKVTIEDRPSSSISGTIQSVTYGDGCYSVKLRKSDGSSATYLAHPDVLVKRGSDSLRMKDLGAGDTATLRIKGGNVAVRITVID